ncbi:XtrA/YqaO family protein [Bacillus sp. 37MA]|uniref:XtrA/YqaO family protein n=1 Tax=Bacillus sp. 37MA TaxID=1132442 RepID=UPI00036D92A8|nr:XtrA/YqaO family protein [Bacillus sp. 37MA]
MKLRELEINPSTMVMKLDIMELNNKAVVICDGKVKIADLPQHGETKIITHQGKVKRVKWDQGEEF